MPDSLKDMVALGAPCVLTTWGFDLLRDISSVLGDEIEIRVIDRNDEIEDLGEVEGRRRLLCLSQFTGPSLQKAISAGTFPIVIFLDDPIDSVRYLKFISHCTTVEALRTQTAANAGYASLFGNPAVLVVHRAMRGVTYEIIREIFNHFDLKPSALEFAAIARKFIGPDKETALFETSLAHRVDGHQSLELATDSLTPDEMQTIADVLSPITHMIVSRNVAPIVWPTAVFFSGDRPDQPAPLVAEVTGGARILYYGPYLYLPAGKWMVKMMVGFTDGAKGTPFSIEVYSGHLLARAIMNSEGKGVFYASFTFTHDTPHDAVEIRVRSDRGAIEGQFALGRVEFTRQTEDATDISKARRTTR